MGSASSAFSSRKARVSGSTTSASTSPALSPDNTQAWTPIVEDTAGESMGAQSAAARVEPGHTREFYDPLLTKMEPLIQKDMEWNINNKRRTRLYVVDENLVASWVVEALQKDYQEEYSVDAGTAKKKLSDICKAYVNYIRDAWSSESYRSRQHFTTSDFPGLFRKAREHFLQENLEALRPSSLGQTREYNTIQYKLGDHNIAGVSAKHERPMTALSTAHYDAMAVMQFATFAFIAGLASGWCLHRCRHHRGRRDDTTPSLPKYGSTEEQEEEDGGVDEC
ncbi:unnamed protein product [Amoebophrya sp. A25]|nr:unnamed protein product [Amoebophrya sp. A25]|eukprot:GSA25T00018522001.1